LLVKTGMLTPVLLMVLRKVDEMNSGMSPATCWATATAGVRCCVKQDPAWAVMSLCNRSSLQPMLAVDGSNLDISRGNCACSCRSTGAPVGTSDGATVIC
jgi:hypothetical protein